MSMNCLGNIDCRSRVGIHLDLCAKHQALEPASFQTPGCSTVVHSSTSTSVVAADFGGPRFDPYHILAPVEQTV